MDHCAHCQNPSANQLCTGCRGVVYCSAEHQKAHWNTHKATCKKLKAALTNGVVKETTQASSTPENKPKPGQHVTATYKGYLPSGKVFDQSPAEGFSFHLGAGEVIKAWDQGIAQMAIGEHATLFCSAAFAYGARGAPPDIPPNYPIIFDIVLLSAADHCNHEHH